MISEEEFKGWLQHPVTKAARELFLVWYENEKDDWASGKFTHETCEGTAMKQANAIGRCEGYHKCAAFEWIDFSTELEGSADGKQERATTPGSGSAD